MVTVRKEKPMEVYDDEAHALGGTLGMTAGGVAGGIAAGAGAAVLGGTVGGVAAGPLGAVAGAAIGGALGSKAGEKVAREINPTAEERYGEESDKSRPYVTAGSDYETYRPAYRYVPKTTKPGTGGH